MYWWLNYLLQFSSFNYWKSALNFLWAKHFMKTWVWIWHSWKELKSQMESSPRHTSVESKSNVHFTVHWEEKNRKKGGFYFKFGILLPLIFSATVRKKISTDREKLLKFKAEGREFAKFLRSLEKCIQYLFILEVSNI